MTAVIWASASIRCFISTLTTGETGVAAAIVVRSLSIAPPPKPPRLA
jgi:hypothetical protein